MARPAKARAVETGKTAPKPKPTSKRRPAESTASNDAESDYEATKSRKKKMPANGAKKSTARKGPARSSKKDRWGEEFLTTNSKSPIVDVDLVKLLAHPSAWTCLDEEEKKEIIDLLPDHIRPAPDPDDPEGKIPPPSQEFLRYSNNWRDAVRQYQVDVQSGRYDPEWLRQAAEAMEERADGAFDKWKEEQFEEFWGQKQKMDRYVSAGESSKIRLTTLVENNCVRVGDVWKYARAFGKGPDRVLVEKEVKVIGIDGGSLTFAIPPGRRLVCSATDAEHTEMTESIAADPLEGPSESVSNNGTRTPVPAAASTVAETDGYSSDPSDVPVLVQQAPCPSPDSGTIANNGDTSGPGPDVAGSVPVAQSITGAGSMNDAEPMVTDTHIDGNIAVTDLPGSGKPAAVHQHNARLISVIYHSDGDSELSSIEPSSQVFDFEDMEMPGPLAFTIPDARGRDKKKLQTDIAPQHTTGPSNERDSRMEIDVPQPLQEPKAESAQSEADGPHVKEEHGRSEEGAKQMTIFTEAKQNATKPTEQTLPQVTTEGQKDTAMKDVILKNVVSPKTVEDKILRIDGRITNPSHGNAWHYFRCFRRNDDMGSLWDVRQHWYVRQSQ